MHPQMLGPKAEENRRARQSAEADQRHGRARSRIVDQIERPRQARHDNDRQHRYADHAVDQH